MRKLLLIGAIIALAGCAQTGNVLQSVNESLKAANKTLAGGGTIATLGEANGYQATNLSVPADRDVCDQTAYMDGFKTGYVQSWNQLVDGRANLFRLNLQNRPKDTAAKANYKLYHGKKIVYGDAGTKEVLYGVKWDASGKITNFCQSNSYTKGKNAGLTAASNDFRTLQQQEVAGGINP